MSDSVCGTCAICLGSIAPENEAFLDTCFHHFCYKCIKAWTHTQRQHPPQRGPRFTCPACRQGYYSIIFDCHESAFRQDQVATPPRGAGRSRAGPSSSFAHLTSAHRRRRSVYYSPPTSDALGSSGGGSSRAGPDGRVAPGGLSPQLIARADVPRWVERELQALMWQDDVALVAQHVLGTLRSAAQPSRAVARAPVQAQQQQQLLQGAQGPAGGGMLLKRKALAFGGPKLAACPPAPEAVAAAVAQAAAPYVFEHAQRFGRELVGFVASGLALAAHDRRLWAEQPPPAAMPLSAAGEAGASSGEAAGSDSSGRGGRGSEGGQGGVHSQPSSSADWSGRNGGSSDEEGAGGGGAGAESPGGYGAGARGRSDDDEGYLELLLAQGRRRRRREGPALGAGVAAELGDPGSQGQVDAAAQPPDTGGGTPVEEQQQQQQQRLKQRPAVAAAAGSGGSAAELEGLRSRALQALQQFRGGGGAADVSPT